MKLTSRMANLLAALCLVLFIFFAAQAFILEKTQPAKTLRDMSWQNYLFLFGLIFSGLLCLHFDKIRDKLDDQEEADKKDITLEQLYEERRKEAKLADQKKADEKGITLEEFYEERRKKESHIWPGGI